MSSPAQRFQPWLGVVAGGPPGCQRRKLLSLVLKWTPAADAPLAFGGQECPPHTRKSCVQIISVTLRDALSSAISRLTAANVPSPRMNAELLLMFTLECDRAYLHAHPERKLSTDEQTRYTKALTERERGMPAQYITGHQEFWGMDFIVTPAVLIPRPETEHVIETVLECVGRTPSPADFLRIVDVGTGSGASRSP